MYYRELDASECLQQLVSSQQANITMVKLMLNPCLKRLYQPHTELCLIGLLDVNGQINLTTLYYLEEICLSLSTFLFEFRVKAS